MSTQEIVERGQRWDRLIAEINGHPLVGTDGIRDVNAPCEMFENGTPSVGNTCETDGHYVCDDCAHRATCEGCGRRPTHCECPGGQYGPYLDIQIGTYQW